MRETELMREIQLAMSKLGHRCFRNQAGTYKLDDGRYLSSGLTPGASDLIGWTKGGRFLAIEVKTPGARTKPERLEAQRQFISQVNAYGGVGFFASSVEEAVEKIGAMA